EQFTRAFSLPGKKNTWEKILRKIFYTQFFIIPTGRWDIRRAYVTGQKHTLNKYINQLLERASEKIRMKNLTAEPGEKRVTQAVLIWDLGGLSKKQMTSMGFMDFCLNLSKLFEGQYPEIVKISIVVNGKLFFRLKNYSRL
ncbi:unnamed protein product, partial [Allacma fusca]